MRSRYHTLHSTIRYPRTAHHTAPCAIPVPQLHSTIPFPRTAHRVAPHAIAVPPRGEGEGRTWREGRRQSERRGGRGAGGRAERSVRRRAAHTTLGRPRRLPAREA
eukprot:1910109-Rhodomonas_salina.2